MRLRRARPGSRRTAGAVGVIYGSDVNAFSAGVTGDADIPAMLTVNQATVAIKAQLDASNEVRVTMTNDLRNGVSIRNPKAIDQLAGFSSRGVGVAGGVKPDVAGAGRQRHLGRRGHRQRQRPWVPRHLDGLRLTRR